MCTRNALYTDQIYEGVGRCHKEAHAAHPRRNKKRGGALKAVHTVAVTLQCAQTRQEKFLLVCPKQQSVTSNPWLNVGAEVVTLRKGVGGLLILERTDTKNFVWLDEKWSVALPYHFARLESKHVVWTGMALTPRLRWYRRMLWIMFCGDTVHFPEAVTSLPVHAGSLPIGAPGRGTFWQEDERRCRKESGAETWDDGGVRSAPPDFHGFLLVSSDVAQKRSAKTRSSGWRTSDKGK